MVQKEAKTLTCSLFVLSTAFLLLARCIQQQMFSSTLHHFAGVHDAALDTNALLVLVYCVYGIMSLSKKRMIVRSPFLPCFVVTLLICFSILLCFLFYRIKGQFCDQMLYLWLHISFVRSA